MTISGKDIRKLAKAAALSHSDDPKDQDRARARKTDVDYKDLIRQLKAKRKKANEEVEVEEGVGRAAIGAGIGAMVGGPVGAAVGGSIGAAMGKKKKVTTSASEKKQPVNYFKAKPKVTSSESFEIDKSAHKSAQKKAKLRNLAKGNTNPNEKAAAEKKAGGPKLYGEEDNYGQAKKELKATKKARDERHKAIHSGTNTAKNTDVNEGRTFADWKKAAAKVLKKKDQEKKPQKAMDAGARAKRKLQRKEYAAKISGSEDNVPDEMRD